MLRLVVFLCAAVASTAHAIPWVVEWDGRWRLCMDNASTVQGIEWTDVQKNASTMIWLDDATGQPLLDIVCSQNACTWPGGAYGCIVPRQNDSEWTIEFLSDRNASIALSSWVNGTWTPARAVVPARPIKIQGASATTTTTVATSSWLWAPLVGSAVAIVALVVGLALRRRYRLHVYRQQRVAREHQVSQSIPPSLVEATLHHAQDELDEALDQIIRKR